MTAVVEKITDLTTVEEEVTDLIEFLITEYSPLLSNMPRAAATELCDVIHENLPEFFTRICDILRYKRRYDVSSFVDENDIIDVIQTLPGYYEIMPF